MSDTDPDKTRVMRPSPGLQQVPPDASLDPNQTMMMQASPRAAAAAAALKNLHREQHAEGPAEKFDWSGEIDFDVTLEAGPAPPPPASAARIATRIVVIAGVVLLVGGLYWSLR